MSYDLGHEDGRGTENLNFKNLWMLQVREAMDELGMLCHVRCRRFPSLPDWVYLAPDVQKIYDHFNDGWDLPEGADPKLVKRIGTYLERTWALLDEEPLKPARGIPAYKLSSCDDWLVSPNEVRSALDACKASGRRIEDIFSGPRDLELWAEWIAWLEESVECGGFRVS